MPRRSPPTADRCTSARFGEWSCRRVLRRLHRVLPSARRCTQRSGRPARRRRSHGELTACDSQEWGGPAQVEPWSPLTWSGGGCPQFTKSTRGDPSATASRRPVAMVPRRTILLLSSPRDRATDAALPQRADVRSQAVRNHCRIGVVSGDVDDRHQCLRVWPEAVKDLHGVPCQVTGRRLVSHRGLPAGNVGNDHRHLTGDGRQHRGHILAVFLLRRSASRCSRN